MGADAVRLPRHHQHVLRRHLQAELAEERAAAGCGIARSAREASPGPAGDPAASVAVDLAAQTLTLPDGTKVEFPVEAFSKYCLLEGVDELGFLKQHEAQIAAYEVQRTSTLNTLAS